MNRTLTWIWLPCVAILAVSAPAHAQMVPFKVYITELWQLDEGVDPGIGLIADYYAKVTINGQEQSNEGACSDSSSTGILVPLQMFKNFDRISQCSARTPWRFLRDVPAGQPVNVKIQIFDSDSIFDNEADAMPGDAHAIELTVDPATGQWTGDFTWPRACSRTGAAFALGGGRVNVCWQLGFDTDDDGLLDPWERYGVDTDYDGVLDVNLPGLGADWRRQDVFVEVDHLLAATHSHSPSEAVLARLVTAFANAPVVNPDATRGVQLHLDVGPLLGPGVLRSVTGANGATGVYGDLGGGNTIGEAGNEIIEAFESPKGSATKFADLKAAHLDATRATVFRYAIFGHQSNSRFASGDCTGGGANITRLDFFVTLGGQDVDGAPCAATDVNGYSVGSILSQAGTFMHELGHTLGLRHGGGDGVGSKPSYLSVMNYNFQGCSVPTHPGVPGGCDYSRDALSPLIETSLDECVGFGFGPQDWNGVNGLEGVSGCSAITNNVTADANNDGVCITPGLDGRLDTPPQGDDTFVSIDRAIHDGPNRTCESATKVGSDDVQVTPVGGTPSQAIALNGFDDWDNIVLGLFDPSIGFGSGNAPIEQEADTRALAEARQYLAELMAPALVLDMTGPATAKPGDTLTYTVRTTNTGRGPAMAAMLQQMKPDGTLQASDLGTLVVGSDVMENMVFTVPATGCPGTFTSASASLSFTDFVSNGFTATDSVSLQILDVTAPTLAISLSPNILWEPNHMFQPITATITVTDNCDPSPAVTLVSITSNEPQAGFIGQGDIGPDIGGAAFGTDDRFFSVRAERRTAAGSTGRIYTVTYRVTDASGNTTERSATVTVPTSNK